MGTAAGMILAAAFLLLPSTSSRNRTPALPAERVPRPPPLHPPLECRKSRSPAGCGGKTRR